MTSKQKKSNTQWKPLHSYLWMFGHRSMTDSSCTQVLEVENDIQWNTRCVFVCRTKHHWVGEKDKNGSFTCFLYICSHVIVKATTLFCDDFSSALHLAHWYRLRIILFTITIRGRLMTKLKEKTMWLHVYCFEHTPVLTCTYYIPTSNFFTDTDVCTPGATANPCFFICGTASWWCNWIWRMRCSKE